MCPADLPHTTQKRNARYMIRFTFISRFSFRKIKLFLPHFFCVFFFIWLLLLLWLVVAYCNVAAVLYVDSKNIKEERKWRGKSYMAQPIHTSLCELHRSLWVRLCVPDRMIEAPCSVLCKITASYNIHFYRAPFRDHSSGLLLLLLLRYKAIRVQAFHFWEDSNSEI